MKMKTWHEYEFLRSKIHLILRRGLKFNQFKVEVKIKKNKNFLAWYRLKIGWLILFECVERKSV